ncbi:MAG: COG2426 family protein [Candidatus Woesearchaeota archaeon]
MIREILFLIILTFLPLFELRLSIPVGILSTIITLPFNIQTQGFNLNPILVATICILANILLGIIIYNIIFIVKKYLINFKKINSFLDKFLNKAHKKLKPFTEKYGILGVIIFIAIPLPGSGSYTAALGSYILGIKKKDFYIANAIGVLIAGILVTLITTGAISIFS